MGWFNSKTEDNDYVPEDCPICIGRGYINGDTCDACKGSGDYDTYLTEKVRDEYSDWGDVY